MDHSDVQTNILKLMLSVCWISLSTIFTWNSADLYFNRQLAFQWAPTLPPYLLTYFSTRMRQNLYVQDLLKAGTKRLAQPFNFTYRYIDDVLSLNNSKITEFIDVIYPCELDIKDTTESSISASYLDCYLNSDNGKFIILRKTIEGYVFCFYFIPKGIIFFYPNN